VGDSMGESIGNVIYYVRDFIGSILAEIYSK